MPSVPASYHVRHKCKSLSQHGAYGSSQKRQRPYPQKLCHWIPQFPSLFQHHHPRSRPVLQFLIPHRLQRLFPLRLLCHLPLYPNPMPLTLLQHSRPFNMVTSQRWGLLAGPPPACPCGCSSSSMSQWVCPGSTPSSRAHYSCACYYSREEEGAQRQLAEAEARRVAADVKDARR